MNNKKERLKEAIRMHRANMVAFEAVKQWNIYPGSKSYSNPHCITPEIMDATVDENAFWDRVEKALKEE